MALKEKEREVEGRGGRVGGRGRGGREGGGMEGGRGLEKRRERGWGMEREGGGREGDRRHTLLAQLAEH